MKRVSLFSSASASAIEAPVALGIIPQSATISTNIGSTGTLSNEEPRLLAVRELSSGTEDPLDRQESDSNGKESST